jgi:hypothetical protein
MRRAAGRRLAQLRSAIHIAPEGRRSGYSDYVEASGFLPEHRVTIYIDRHRAETLTASTLGTVTYVIRPHKLGLRAGPHTIAIDSMLIRLARRFSVR